MECSVNFSSTRNGSGGKIRANASIRQGLEPIEARVSTKISATISKIVSIGFKPPAEAFSALPPYLFGSQPPDSSDIANAYLEEAIDPPADGVEAPAPRVLGQGSIPIPLTTINGMSLLSLRSLRFGQVYIDKTGISSGGTVSFYINDSLVATKTPDNNDFYLYVNINAGDILKIESNDGQFNINALSLIPSENVDFKVEFSLRQLDSIYVGEKKNSATYGGEYFDTKFITQQDGWEKYRVAAFTSNNDDSYAFGFGPNPKVTRFGGVTTDSVIDGENALSQNPPLYTNSPKSMISNKKIEGFVYPYGEGDYTSDIRSFASFATTSIKATITIRGTDTAVVADKYGGHVDKFASYKNGFPATQVFYPKEDIESVNLVDKTLTSGSLYQSVDEGTFVKTANGLINITDDYGSFIQSNQAFTQGGSYRYKFGVDNPNVTPRENFLVIRAAAPFNSIESEVSSKYKIHNIRFEDPSGDLIVKYKDIDFRGDSDYTYENEKYNFTTYITEPEINYVKFSTWHPNFPILSEPSGYTVSFDVDVDVIHDPFSSEFNKGYQHDIKRDKFVETTNSDYMANYGSPLSTMTQNLGPTPTPSFRISNIDLIASGTLLGFLTENRLLLNTEFPPTGVMLERDIYPTRVLGNNFVTGIEPEVKSVWKSSADANDNVYYNTDEYNLDNLTTPLADPLQVNGFVKLESTEPIADSGKLKLLYEHAPPYRVRKRQGGAFSFGADNIDNEFDTAKVDYVYIDDSYFDIYEIELHVRARKAFGSRDYSLDVVGYSNDDVMIETKAVGGFLQSASGVGTIPQSSGWNPVNDLGLSSESISERDHFFVTNKTNNDGGDHYLLSQSPVIDSTEFKDYIIPLKIYKDNVVQGQSPNYAVSKYFESLYVDIYPIPVGAAIAKANLVVKYHPAKTMPLHILGTGSNELTRSNITLTPSARKTNDERFNAVWTDKPLSSIEDIPHGYKAPNKEPTLKTNYSRRWRGVDGNVQVGAFNPAEFDYSFEFNQISQPFLDGYFDFNKTTNNVVTTSLEDEVNVSGEFNSDLEASKTTNLGLRFNSDKLFSTQLHNYKTIDWVTNTNHELYGHIMDAYENAVRISGSDGCFDFGDHSMSGGFNVFCRFSPDVTISGANYNLFNSGVILSKWDADKDLEFALGFDQGKLCGYARDTSDNIVKVTDTLDYYDYQYPLSVMLSYNDNNSQKLRLYADNEIVSGDFNVLRASSSAFTMPSGDSNLIVGHSYGSGVGMNAFLTDVGISTSGNITVNSYEKSKLQTTAERFFAGHRSKFWNNDESTTHDRYKMWDYVDQETDKWYLGAFKYCEFNSAFDTMKTRIGQDFIVHNFSNNNKSYEDITDLAIPASLNTSGVAYHTQVENDMLRLNVGGLWDQFYAAPPRISKSYPRSYDLKEDTFSVKTVIQNSSNTDIEWPDGNLGPRLIVSLYTKSKESVHFESTNWGLINRSIHYLAPDMCWIKLNSKFNLRDLKDKTTEPWSNFVKEQNVTELNHKYFSNDVNDLYIQYDLVYPTGNYDSTIKIHSVDVKMNQAITEAVELDTKFPLMASGDTVVRNELKLAQYNSLGFVESDTPVNPQKPFKFATLGRDPTYSSGELWLETSGANMVFADAPNELPLMTRSAEPVTSNNDAEGNFTQTPIFGASSDTFDQYGTSVVLGLDFETDLNNLSPYKMTTSSSSPLQARNASLLPNAPNLESLEIVSNAAKFGSGSIKQQCGSNSKGVFFNDGSNQIQSNTTLQNSLTLDPNIWGGDYNIDFWIYLPQFPTLSTNLSEFKSRIWSASKSIPLNIGALSETKDFKFEMDLMSTWNGTEWKHDLVLLRTLNPRYFLDVTYQDSWKFPETQILKIEDISSLEWNYVSFGSFSSEDFAEEFFDSLNSSGASTNFFASQGAGTTAQTYWRGNDFNISFAALNGSIKSYSPDRGYWSLDDVNPSILSDHSYPALILGDHWYPENPQYANTDISQSLKDIMFYYIDEMRVTLGAPRIEVSRSTSSVTTDTVPTATMPDPTATTTTTTSTTTAAPRGLKLAVTGGTPDIRNGDISLYLRNTELEIFESGVLPINILPGVRGLFEDFSLMADGGAAPAASTKNAQFVLYTVTPPLQDSINADFALTVKATFNTNVFDSGNMPLVSFNEATIPEGVGATSFSFNSESYGSFIDVADTSLLTLRPDDEIRGVTTICFGGCDYNGNCNELELITHDTLWRPAGCVNGGILRPLTTFTDPNAIAFNGDQSGGYKNNYYGVRKYTGLMPAGTYSVTLVGRTGSDGIIDVPREIVEWEYGTNEDVDYTGLKLVDETTRQIEDRYGKSVSIVGDLMTVGAPGYDLLDFSGFECVDAGTVFVYRRNPEPSGYDWTTQDDKSDWEVEATLSLSPHFRRDYYENVPWVLRDGSNDELARFNARKWHVGQEGREFGYSTSIAKMDDREVVAVGGPRAKFTRTFDAITTSPINLCVLIFTDEFLPKLPEGCSPNSWRNPCVGPEAVEQYMRGKDLLYKYFADPAVEFNTKVIIFEPVLGVNTVTDELNFEPEVIERTNGIVKKYRIHRHTSQYVDSNGHIKYDGFDTTSQHYKDRDALIYSQIKSAFDAEVPYDTSKPHNNIPVVLGASVDNSWSMGGIAAIGTALDKFFSFYDDYSLASGVTRFDTGTPTSGYRKLFELEGDESTTVEDSTGTNLPTSYIAEDWLGKSIFVLGQLTNFNYININGYDKLISNNIGVYNTAAAEFNEVPASGGAVYLYEKLNTSPDWKLIQVIDSPTAGNDEYPDGFGHVVKLSEDGSILGIGSPYSKSQVGIYNRPINRLSSGDNAVALSFASWMFGRSEPELVSLGVVYNEQSALVGNIEAAKDIYSRVSDSGRFRFLQEQDIKPYRNFYNMTQTFMSNGWGWMAEKFIPTARLGYSIAFNKDGSTVAIGAPTDSLGQHDNQSAWYQPKRNRATDWKGYVNAGAVRVLDSRKYYPHKGVQEWGRFGNLHETLEKNDSNEQLFENHMRNIYNSMGKPFTRTEADGTEILDTTGLLYIITPEVDALSDQTLQKLKEWLAKGDRHLVLVGNDPIWERDGVYSQGNNILNNILFELNSRMKLHPARNEYESLAYNTVGELHSNVVASMKPANSLTTYISNIRGWGDNTFSIGQVRGSGVGDIRYYNPQMNSRYVCEARKTDILTGLPALRQKADKAVYHEVNTKCEMPITHEGDLRAQWVDQCAVKTPTGGIAFTNYYMNISFAVGTNQFYYYGCDDQLRSRSELEPIPMMVAAEYKTKTLVSPEVPDRTERYQVLTGFETLPASSILLNPVLTSGNKLTPDFLYVGSEEQSNYVYKNLNENSSISSNTWFDPEEYRGRDTVLQARANVRNETQTTIKEVSEYYAAAVQSVSYDQADGSSLNSEVVLVSNTLSEKQSVLNDSQNDANILFYHNLVAMANSRGGPGKKGRVRIAQIGGWTNRTSFVAGYGSSFLSTLFSTISNASDFDIGIQENVSMDSLIDRTNAYDVAWIANTDQSPSADDLDKIKQFLSYGGKRLIVTYGPENDSELGSSDTYSLDAAYIDKLDTVSQLMSDLNVDMKPMYLPNKDRYVDFRMDIRPDASSAELGVPSTSYLLSPTPRHDFLQFQNYPLMHGPVDIRNGGTALLGGAANDAQGDDIRIYDDVFSEIGFADFETGMARVKFDIPADASETEARAYKFFLTISRESPNEEHYPSIIFRNAKIQNIYSDDNVKKGDEDSAIPKWEDPSTKMFSPVAHPRLHIRTGNTGTGVKLPLKSKDIGAGSRNKYREDREGNTVYGDAYNLEGQGVPRKLESLGTGGVNTLEFDVLLANDATDFEVIAYHERRAVYPTAEPEKYKTVRIVAVSGIKTDLITLDRSRDIPIYDWAERVVPGRPEIITTYNYSGPITTSSEKYCPSDFCVEHFGNPGPNIADGPVVMAHEVYHQGGFDAGMAKSRITVISDASIIQGPEITEKGKPNITQNLTSLLRSLYPPSVAQNDNFQEFPDSDFIYDNAYKVISPEQLSPAKLIQANPTNTGLNMRFGGYSSNSLPHSSFEEFPAFTSYLSDLEPQKRMDNILTYWNVLEPIDSFGPFKERRVPPVVLPEPAYSILKEQLRQAELDRFSGLQTYYGSTARFSGIIEGTMYTDASIYGGVPQIMQDTGYDYLDFERFPSGYPGDLFGYDVQIHNDELYISAPFTAFSGTDITTWDTVVAQTPQGPIYKTQVGHNGGAGAVYIFEKKTVDTTEIKSYALNFYKSKQWQVKQKVRPEEINVGTKITDTSVATTNLGSHSYTSEQLRDNTIVGDMFGHKMALDGDVMAISAPGHDFENVVEENKGAFVRKEFNEQFDIGTRKVHDLATLEARSKYPNSGTVVLNNGAVFTYENRISNWGSKLQEWTQIHKVVPQGSGSRVHLANENDYFGMSLALDRVRRNDASYTLAAGSHMHQYATSGSIDTSAMNQAGAIYTQDGMLRKLRPSFAHPDTFLEGRIFGSLDAKEPYSYFSIKNDGKYDEEHLFNRVVTANTEGEIFIEASGQDKIDKGYIVHRPYLWSIGGTYQHGTEVKNYQRLHIEGRPPEASGDMPLVMKAQPSFNVYNSMLMNISSAYTGTSGNMPIYASGRYVEGSINNTSEDRPSGLTLFVDSTLSNSGNMNLYVKGKF